MVVFPKNFFMFSDTARMVRALKVFLGKKRVWVPLKMPLVFSRGNVLVRAHHLRHIKVSSIKHSQHSRWIASQSKELTTNKTPPFMANQ